MKDNDQQEPQPRNAFQKIFDVINGVDFRTMKSVKTRKVKTPEDETARQKRILKQTRRAMKRRLDYEACINNNPCLSEEQKQKYLTIGS